MSATFVGASEDGSRVFFLSEQLLLKGAHGKSLYEYDFNAPKGNRVVLVAPGIGGGGIVRVSEDGSHVYFVAQSVLTEGPNEEKKEPIEGEANLYVYDTETSVTSFIGVMSPADGEDWQIRDERPADATPNGHVLIFLSNAHLVPGDTSSLPQLFEYDTSTKALVQISRVQDGIGGEFVPRIVFPSYTGNVNPAPQPSSISNDGSYVAFQSEAALVPHAIEGYNNVYEFHAGRVSLISDGEDRSFGEAGPSVSLIGIDGSGTDIFFTTADQLVPQDGDTQEDVYDARIGGGFLPTSPAMCEGEGCQGPLSPPRSFVTSNSLTQPSGDQVVETPPRSRAKTKATRKGKKAKPRKRARHRARKSASRDTNR